MTRFPPLVAGILVAWPAPAIAAAPPATPPASAPLVLAPAAAPAGPDVPTALLDLALPALVGAAAWRWVPSMVQGADPATSGGLVAGLAIGSCALAPPAALVGLRDRPFAVDSFLAAAAGGLLGLGVGVGASRWLTAGAADPLASAIALGAGQGLGTAIAYHLYRGAKAGAADLDRLPAHRKDDSIDNWKFWRERKNP